MSQRRHEMTTKPVLRRLPAMDAVTVREDLPFGAAGTCFDLYLPPDARADRPCPAVVLVSGYPDPGFEAMLGCKLKQMQAYVDWARLLAASGMAAVTYACIEPVRELAALLEHLGAHGEALGLDARRIGLWAASGNVPNAIGALIDGRLRPRCATLCYGYLLDLGGSTAVAQAAAGIGFANPTHGRSIDELPADLPLLVVRAGHDRTPGLNGTIDAFVAAALARDLPLTLTNVSAAPHAFDLDDDRPQTRTVIDAIVAFSRSHLVG
jgi:hypothetical protein